jgi:isoquinoline 1-oxidoreductase alpha subunit
MINFKLNEKNVQLDVDPEMPLLWALRDGLGLTGTKFGCGIGACGACTVSIEGASTRSCQIPVGDVEGLSITTIEGLAEMSAPNKTDEASLHPVQQAWIEEQVPQCGYCQSGMIMAVANLLNENPSPSDDDIDAAISNICRCGTYPRVRQAIHKLANKINS